MVFQQNNVNIIKSAGMALGIDSGDEFDKILQDIVIPLQKKDLMLVYTDGLVETTNLEEQELGKEAIRAYMAKHASEGSERIVKGLLTLACQFRGELAQADDITMVALQRYE